MKKYFTSNATASFFAIILSAFFVVATVQAATTISTDISTGGALTVTGASTLYSTLTVPTIVATSTTATSTFAGAMTIGTVSPTANALLTLVGNTSSSGNSPYIPIKAHSSFAVGADFYTHADQAFRGPTLNLYKSRGTQSSPTAVQSGDNLAYFGFGGYDGSAYAVGAQLTPFAAETWTTSAHGTQLTFWTNTIGTLTLAQRMALDSNGLGIGVSAPTAPLEVATLSSNATTTVVVGKSGQNKGSCLELYDVTGTVVYVTVQGGALVVSATSCR